jgi:hypothetical protein
MAPQAACLQRYGKACYSAATMAAHGMRVQGKLGFVVSLLDVPLDG